ncbi:MAG: DUF2567 domain-containing protein [Nakamurella sp.]
MTVRGAHLLVLGGSVLAGVLQGVVWAFAAPGVPYKVLADGRFGALPTTSTYHFVGVAAFTLSGIALGVLLAAGAWQARSARGWHMVITLIAGSFVGAAIAWGLGILLAPGVDPASVGASAADSIVTAPPSIGTWLVILAQPALAAALYTWLVAWNGQPDLGRGVVSSVTRPTDTTPAATQSGAGDSSTTPHPASIAATEGVST